MQTDNTVQQINFTCNTNGTGYWSNTARAYIACTHLALTCNDNFEYGELLVYFNTNDWDVTKDGLIYTDVLFMQQLQNELTTLGYDASDVSYSEQGMQGEDFVSCDVGDKFIASWIAKHGKIEID